MKENEIKTFGSFGTVVNYGQENEVENDNGI